jgi:hypothetical protein
VSDEWQRRFLAELVSGPYLPPLGTSGAHRVLIVAFGHRPEELASLAEDLAAVQLHRPELEPILLVDDVDNAGVVGSGFVYESSMSRTELASLGLDLDHRTYLRERIEDMVALYRPARTVVVAPGGRLDPGSLP